MLGSVGYSRKSQGHRDLCRGRADGRELEVSTPITAVVWYICKKNGIMNEHHTTHWPFSHVFRPLYPRLGHVCHTLRASVMDMIKFDWSCRSPPSPFLCTHAGGEGVTAVFRWE